MQEKQDSGWKVKKEISLGDAIAIVSATVAIIFSWHTLDKRISLLENDSQKASVTQASTDNRQDIELFRYQQRIDAHLSDINRKLDKLIEGRR